jgi:hypothetical protein
VTLRRPGRAGRRGRASTAPRQIYASSVVHRRRGRGWRWPIFTLCLIAFGVLAWLAIRSDGCNGDARAADIVGVVLAGRLVVERPVTGARRLDSNGARLAWDSGQRQRRDAPAIPCGRSTPRFGGWSVARSPRAANRDGAAVPGRLVSSCRS